ncbi:MAG: hypothetical protein QM661_02490 [Solimonas sp.]
MRITPGLAALLMPALAAPSFAADLQRCASIDDAATRLACYDQAAGHPAAAPAAPAATANASPERFGAEQLRGAQAAEAQQPSAMQAHIVGTFEGWQPKTRFKLDNGQVWVVVDDRSAYFPATQNPAVTVEKGLFGAYYLKIDSRDVRTKVKRVR